MNDFNDIDALNVDSQNDTEQNNPPSGEETPDQIDSAAETDNTADPFASTLNKVEFTPAGDYKQKKGGGTSKGIKIFSLVMAAVILLTGACAVGYVFGVKKTAADDYRSLNLASKPKNEDEYTPAQVYQKLNKSIVGIRVYNKAGKMSDVSGIIYSKDGYIISNDHMYASVPSPMFKVFMYDGSEYDAEYVAGDQVSDLAVLKIKNVSELEVPQFGDPSEIVCGENVVAIGRPSDATGKSSITSGVVSLTGRRVKSNSGYSASMIQTDSAINPGNSGGALCNMYGQVIGVTTSKLVGADYEAFGFAIPSNTVKRVVEQLIKSGKVLDRAKLGITYTEVNSVTQYLMNYESTGLLVATVSSDSDISGKVVAGDMITHINGELITSDDTVLDIIESSKAGDKITLTVLSQKGVSTVYNVVLKANIGESSYSTADPFASSSGAEDKNSGSDSGSSSGGTFDFPDGE